MSPEDRRLTEEEERLEEDLEFEDQEEEISRIQAFLQDRRKLATTGALFVLLLVAIYVLLPKLTDAGDTLERVGSATWYWVIIAVAFNAVSFLAYMTLFRVIIGGRHGGEGQARPPPRPPRPN